MLKFIKSLLKKECKSHSFKILSIEYPAYEYRKIDELQKCDCFYAKRFFRLQCIKCKKEERIEFYENQTELSKNIRESRRTVILDMSQMTDNLKRFKESIHKENKNS